MDKFYYSIREVSDMLGVNSSLLRFWETQFPQVRPHKNSRGIRCYTADDIALLRHIYHLTKERGFTLDGARDQLKAERRTADNVSERDQIIAQLSELRSFLLDLKNQL